MIRLYADEQFPLPVVELLRELGHDVLTVQESGNAGFSDPQVLAFAIANERAVLTINRRDFKQLHRLSADHAGIVVCSEDLNFVRLANRIHQSLIGNASLQAQLIVVNRGSQ
ncbi:DUF5615 family PIN-like protein [Pantanalinema rosaneae CENA516]|uniref:DUF5615 family PIN-like protein n=1 Tax=Pantanalinema rosaneae TaxID=1620701 RepID=UPI003D6EE506